MNEPVVPSVNQEAVAAPTTAGALLRQARQARGLHIAALANSIKVTPQKLELLETDRHDELPGNAFTRALAQTVCRFLKIDSTPVMALLPPPPGQGLDRMMHGLNEPFHSHPGRRAPKDLQFLKNPAVLGAILLLVAILGISLLPKNWFGSHLPDATVRVDGAAAPAVVTQTISPTMPPAGEAATLDPGIPLGTATSSIDAPPDSAIRIPDSAVVVPPVIEPPALAASEPDILRFSATATSWVQVTDRQGGSLLSRRLKAGESLAIEGTPPLRLKINNASAVRVSFKGRPVDLGPITSRGVARVELK